MELTRSKIAYNLKISPHRQTLAYGGDIITFVFSSELYMNKFLDKLANNRFNISTSLTNRFGFTVHMNLLSDLKLYKTIEKRGFLIIKDNTEVTCPDQIVLGGLNLTLTNYGE